MATVRACCISFGAFWAHGQGSGLGPLHSPVQCCAQAEGPCVLSGHLERGALWCECLSPCRASLHLMLHDSKLHSISALRPAIFQSLADSVTHKCVFLTAILGSTMQAAACAVRAGMSSDCSACPPVLLSLSTCLSRPVHLSLSSHILHAVRIASLRLTDADCPVSGGATLADIWDRGAIAVQDPLCGPPDTDSIDSKTPAV